MRELVATTVASLALFVMGFVLGVCCAPPPAVITKIKTVPGPVIEVSGPERIVEIEVEKIIVDPKDAVENARLSAELAGVTADRDRLAAESTRNLAGWRKTYVLWKALRDRQCTTGCP